MYPHTGCTLSPMNGYLTKSAIENLASYHPLSNLFGSGAWQVETTKNSSFLQLFEVLHNKNSETIIIIVGT